MEIRTADFFTREPPSPRTFGSWPSSSRTYMCVRVDRLTGLSGTNGSGNSVAYFPPLLRKRFSWSLPQGTFIGISMPSRSALVS